MILLGCLHVSAQQNTFKQTGVASYYSTKFEGRKTANGEKFTNNGYTAAHNRLKFGTYVKVTNTRTGKWVVVRINDKLHQSNKRIVDLTRRAAKQLGLMSKGVTKVRLEVIPKEEGKEWIEAQMKYITPNHKKEEAALKGTKKAR